MDDFLHRQSKLSENNLILILEKDLLPTLDEVYQSCQLQTVKALIQIRQLRMSCKNKQDRCSRCFCHSVRSLEQFLHHLIQESNLPFTFQLQ